jgi:hypothetical protein
MRRSAPVLLFVAAALDLITPAAKAQCRSGYCESYGYYSGGGVYGYSRTYGYYGDSEQVHSTLQSPESNILDSSWAQGQYEVVAEVVGPAPSSGDYYITGEHYYWAYEPWWGWNWDGWTSYDVSVPSQIWVSGGGIVNDGGTASFSVSVMGGPPTSYSWSFDYEREPSFGNGPDVQFSNPDEPSTISNSHWFAQPDEECGAPAQSQYTITATVGFNGGPQSAATVLTPVVPWDPGGETYPPQMRVHYLPSCNGAICTVVDNSETWVQRLNPFIMIWIPPSSQFHTKLYEHELVHSNQYGPEGLFENLFNEYDLRVLILQQSAPRAKSWIG